MQGFPANATTDDKATTVKAQVWRTQMIQYYQFCIQSFGCKMLESTAIVPKERIYCTCVP